MKESTFKFPSGNSVWRTGKWLCGALVAQFFINTSAFAERDYTLFEEDPVRPVAALENSGYVAALNVPDDYLELFAPAKNGLKHCASVKVGMRPVAIGVITETKQHARLWVVNHLSDSISILDINLKKCSASLVDTIAVGDEPRDIVVANTPVGKRVFVSMAHRGQTHPDKGTRNWQDLIRTGAENAAKDRPAGLADVAVFDPANTAKVQVVNLFTDTPRALTLGAPNAAGYHTQVFAAGFHTGNQTTVVAAETSRGAAIEHLQHLMQTGDVVASATGELTVTRAGVKMHGGSPAVIGKGRCFPDPRIERKRRHELQVCAQTDDAHNILAFKHQQAGVVDQDCSCTNSQGEIQPVVSMMAKFYASPAQCGDAFSARIGGCWLDQDPALNGIASPAMEWNDWVKLTLPDTDVFALDVATATVTVSKSFAGVGTVLYGMATNPATGKVYVVNQEANNLSRFEGFGHFTGTSVRGNMTQSRISVLGDNQVAVKPINDHLGLLPNASAKQSSLAFPVAVAISANKSGKHYAQDQQLYFAALGSDKLAYVSTSALDSAAPGTLNQKIKTIELGKKGIAGQSLAAGPVGISLDQKNQRIYVLARFTNELIVINTRQPSPQLVARYAMHNPEPTSVTRGRALLYAAKEMSVNGDQACASCHVFSNNDSLAWDLGNPDLQSINNPGPFVSPPAVGHVEDLAVDPAETSPFHAVVNPDFRANKGPMLTQPLRGLANHGALHWRGDRVRNVQTLMGQQPDIGTLDEESSIREFDEAVRDLTGSDHVLQANKMDDLASYLMQISYPPNPLRRLNDTLTDDEAAGRAAFFGCQSMTDEQFARRECVGTNGQIVQIDAATRECECFGNPLRFVMERLTHVQAFASALASLQFPGATDPAQQARIAELQTSLDALKPLAQQVATLTRQPLSSLAVSGNQASYNSEAQVYSAAQLDRIQLLLAGANHPAQSAGLVALVNTVKAAEQEFGISLLPGLLAQLDLAAVPADKAAKLKDPAQVTAALVEWFGDVNVSRKPLLDAQLVAGQEQNLLRGCSLNKTPQSCPLRIADSLTTCQGCHVLDPNANKEFGSNFPGFFGTSGEYAFSNIPQVFKVPHLRNLYSRVGKFGQPHEAEMFVGQSVFGIREGGFFNRHTPIVGPSVRGYGFSHDGSADTVHRFAGLLDFLRRPAGFLGGNDVRGNPDAFDAFLPSDPQACLTSVVQGRDAFFDALYADRGQMMQAAGAAIAGDKAAAGQIVMVVLSSPAVQSDLRWQAIAGSALDAFMSQKPISDTHAAPIVEAVAASLFCPDVPSAQLMPLCFQLGSSLEFGDKKGVCYPAGLKEREAAEAFMLVFDTNLKPMVGQQATLKGAQPLPDQFTAMLAAADAGHCDLGGWTDDSGYLVTATNTRQPLASRLLSDTKKSLTLGELLRKSGTRATFTCYPPKPGKAEARRSVWDRNGDGKPNGIARNKPFGKKGV